MLPRPPPSTPFPYTTLFRSRLRHVVVGTDVQPVDAFRLRVGGTHPRRSEEHTSELQSRLHLVCRLLLEKKHALSAAVRCPVRAIRVPDRPYASGRGRSRGLR